MNLIQNIIFQPPQVDVSEFSHTFPIDCYCVHGKCRALFVETELARGAILFSHGNACDIGPNILEFCQRLARATQCHVFAYDYCGYGLGKAAGQVPSEKCCRANVLASWNWLAQKRYITEDRIWVLGHSLGCAPSCYLAAMRPVAGLTLCAPFLSVRAMATQYAGAILSFVTSIFVNLNGFANDRMAQYIRCKTLVCHGTADQVIPVQQGQLLAQLFKGARTSTLWIADAQHDCLFSHFDQFVSNFLNWQKN